ncbi:Amino acid permease [Candidatus Hydrogenisulfobacillus filiaventi]|uniref:Amino acid permease n=1 Tax=Candidatus Hydrogenisulfobacillus filiaventi TaxID=2707344 RepID=A0A6F8ZJE3_9FIRM|nr:Amino acid permease [Candidatus Hydrogenisulfobacillus filiaventi]
MAEAGRLKRVLPLRTAVSTSAGLASAAVNFLACAQIDHAAGLAGALTLAVAGGLIAVVASHFAELSGLYPSAAAIRVWSRRGSSDTLSLLFSLVYLVTVLFVMAADAFVVAKVFEAAWPAVPGVVWIAALLGLVTAGNLRGVKVAGRVQDINGFLLLVSLAAISVVALVRAPHLAAVPWPGAGGWADGLSIAVFVFVGFEWVTPLAEEFADARSIGRGMYLALVLIAAAFGLFTWALGAQFGRSALPTASAIPQLLLGRQALGALGFWWMAAVSLTTAMTTFNGGLVAASRFIYALARERVLPRTWARLNSRLVPARAVLGLAGTALVLAVAVWLTGAYLFLINVGAAVESFLYAYVAYLTVSLRRREPARARPFRAWGTPWLSWAVLGVFGLLGLGALLAPDGLPGPVPWPLVFLLLLILATYAYIRWAVPRLRRQAAAARLGQGALPEA